MTDSRILVVDDDPIFIAFVRDLARSIGHPVTLLSDPRQFWAIYERIKPTTVVLDVVMPEPNGVELLLWLAEQEVKPTVYLISGYDRLFLTTAGSLAKARGLPVAQCLTKPIESDHLLQIFLGDGNDRT